jgi:small conductance mechanosensitive channel
MDELWRELQDHGAEYLGRAIGALLLIVVGWLAIHFLVGPLRRLLERSRVDPSAGYFLVNTARSIIIIFVLLGVLQHLGIQTTSLIALVGVAGAAIALSLQNSLANFASGLIILSFRMARVGDLVEVGDIRGRITDMLPFHVVLLTADHQRVTLPNVLLTGGPVKNHSSLPTRRVQWTLPLTPQDDLTAVKEALRARLAEDARVLKDEPPRIFVQDWQTDKRVLAVQTWTKTADWEAVQQELLEALGKSVETTRANKA